METSATIMRTAIMPSKKAEIIATTAEAVVVVAIKAKAEVVGVAMRKMAEADSNVEAAVSSNSVVTRTGIVTHSSSLKESPRILETTRIVAMEAVSVIVEAEDVAVVEAAETVTMEMLAGTMPETSVVDVDSPALIRVTALMSAKTNSDKTAIAETTMRMIAPTSPTKIKVRLRPRSRLLILA